ncbi:MAG TPA: WD40 repeat domain-containing protein [Thermoanaerobaculia bacterium]
MLDGRPSVVEQPRSPYVGPRPFTANDAAVFFGRDIEACEILSLVLAYPAVVLYSESGAGKTSLLNARIIPGLIERGCEVIGPVRVSADIGEEFVSSTDVNVYTLSSLLLMDRETKDASKLARVTLSQYLRQRPKPETAHAIRPPRVVIFDQFEELFTTRPERWQDRSRFMQDIGDALEADSRLRVVFALREEFIASLDALAAELPDGLRTRMRLERLRRPAALEAIEKPLEGTDVSFARGVPDLLLDNLLRIPALDGSEALGEFIEPVHLQLVCHRVWESLPEDAKEIQAKDVNTHGDVDTALRAYYDLCVSRVMADSGRSEAQLRSWFQKNFITTDGTRGLVFRTVSNTGGLPNTIVDQFQSLYLVHAETRGGSRWYELAHDRLIAPIIESNRAWRSARDEASLLIDALEKHAERWVQTKDAGLLLRGDELRGAREKMGRDEESFTPSENLRAFVDASEIARERRLRRRFGRQIAAGAAVALVLTALIFYVRWRTQRGERAEERASVARRMIGFQPLEIDALSWALRAYASSSEPQRYDEIVRDALKRVGPTLWLRRNAPIQNALFSPDGKWVITIAAKEICIWDAETGKFLAERAAPKSRIWVEAFFSRSGIVLAQSVPDPGEQRKQFTTGSSMDPKRWTLWDTDSKRLLPQLEDISRHQDVSVAPDRSILAVAYEPKLASGPGSRGVRWIRLFDLNRNQELRAIRGNHAFSFTSLSTDGKFLLTLDESAVRIWETATATEVMKVRQTVGYADVPVVRWNKTANAVFVAFRSPDQFKPTLIHLDAGQAKAIELPIPCHVLDAWFGTLGGKPRLLVRADTATLNNGLIRAYLLSYEGVLQPQEFEIESPESLRWYGRYFDNGTGEIVSVQAEKDKDDRDVGSSYSVIAKNGTRRTVRLPYLDYPQLTSLSSSHDRLLSVANGVARLWNIDQAREMETVSTEKLIATACARFANQKDLRSVLASESVCTDEKQRALQAHM